MAKEDFTTYTEVDPNSRITKTADRVTWTDLTRKEDAYVYKDKGVDHFNGDFEHLITIYLDAATTGGRTGALWGLTNIVDDEKGIADANEDELLVFFYYDGTDHWIYLREYHGGVATTDRCVCALDTPYYLKIKRDESIGTYGRLYCYIYSNPERTTLVDTLQVDLHAKIDFRYIFSIQTYRDEASGTISGYSENLDLQEVPPAVPRSHGYIF